MLDDSTATSRSTVHMDSAVDVSIDQARVFDRAARRFSFKILGRQVEHRRWNRVFQHRMAWNLRLPFLQFLFRYADNHAQSGDGVLA